MQTKSFSLKKLDSLTVTEIHVSSNKVAVLTHLSYCWSRFLCSNRRFSSISWFVVPQCKPASLHILLHVAWPLFCLQMVVLSTNRLLLTSDTSIIHAHTGLLTLWRCSRRSISHVINIIHCGANRSCSMLHSRQWRTEDRYDRLTLKRCANGSDCDNDCSEVSVDRT